MMIRLSREAVSQEAIATYLQEAASRLSAGVHTHPKSIRVLCEVVEALFFDITVEILSKMLEKFDHSNKCNSALSITLSGRRHYNAKI